MKNIIVALISNFYFITGIPWHTLRYIFHTSTIGKLNNRYTVESRPAAPPIIAIIITPRLIFGYQPFLMLCIFSHETILKVFAEAENRFEPALTRFYHELNV